MLPIAEDPTDIALMQAVPFLPVPHSGRSPALDALFAKPAGHGYIAGSDGVFLRVARPWLSALIPLTGPLPIEPAYGLAGPARLDLLCGLIPGLLVDQAASFFRQCLPNEAGGFIIWNQANHTFTFTPAETIESTPSRLSYRPFVTEPDEHIIADIHSHGGAPAFWSSTDDRDDACHTRLSIVVGFLDDKNPSRGEFIARFCACGVFAPLPKQPTTSVDSLSFRSAFSKAIEIHA